MHLYANYRDGRIMIFYVNKKRYQFKHTHTKLKVAITGFCCLPLTLKKIYKFSACRFSGPGLTCVS